MANAVDSMPGANTIRPTFSCGRWLGVRAGAARGRVALLPRHAAAPAEPAYPTTPRTWRRRRPVGPGSAPRGTGMRFSAIGARTKSPRSTASVGAVPETRMVPGSSDSREASCTWQGSRERRRQLEKRKQQTRVRASKQKAGGHQPLTWCRRRPPPSSSSSVAGAKMAGSGCARGSWRSWRTGARGRNRPRGRQQRVRPEATEPFARLASGSLRPTPAFSRMTQPHRPGSRRPQAPVEREPGVPSLLWVHPTLLLNEATSAPETQASKPEWACT